MSIPTIAARIPASPEVARHAAAQSKRHFAAALLDRIGPAKSWVTTQVTRVSNALHLPSLLGRIKTATAFLGRWAKATHKLVGKPGYLGLGLWTTCSASGQAAVAKVTGFIGRALKRVGSALKTPLSWTLRAVTFPVYLVARCFTNSAGASQIAAMTYLLPLGYAKMGIDKVKGFAAKHLDPATTPVMIAGLAGELLFAWQAFKAVGLVFGPWRWLFGALVVGILANDDRIADLKDRLLTALGRRNPAEIIAEAEAEATGVTLTPERKSAEEIRLEMQAAVDAEMSPSARSVTIAARNRASETQRAANQRGKRNRPPRLADPRVAAAGA